MAFPPKWGALSREARPPFPSPGHLHCDLWNDPAPKCSVRFDRNLDQPALPIEVFSTSVASVLQQVCTVNLVHFGKEFGTAKNSNTIRKDYTCNPYGHIFASVIVTNSEI